MQRIREYNSGNKKDFRGFSSSLFTHSTAPGDIHCRQSQFSIVRLPGQSEWLLIVVHGCHGRTSVSPLVGKAPGPAGLVSPATLGIYAILCRKTRYTAHIITRIRRNYDVCGHCFDVAYN